MRKPTHCKWLVRGAIALLAGSVNCGRTVHFPRQPAPPAAGAHRAYDVDRDGSADFFLLPNAAGRVHALGYDRDADGLPDDTVHLDAIKFPQCRHLVLILDGFDYEILKGYYDAGGLRVFHPPSRVIAPYPGMTDLAMEDILGYVPCRGFEALYFDRRSARRVGGVRAYLAGENAPYNRLLDYRASMLWDGLAYVYPWRVFRKEVHDAKRAFDRSRKQEVLAYFVSSAGVGTRRGSDGQRDCLARIEQLVLQVLHETRGLTKVTLLADHGHSYTPGERIEIEKHLKGRGWRVAERLRRPKDVVCVPFGLVTYACFGTKQPAALAADLIELEGVELATYARKDAVVVLAPGKQKALIRRKDTAFRYETVSGDPLRLKGVLAKLPAVADGYHEAEALLKATAQHVYPAPLQRLWRAHFALAESPPDVTVSLADRFYYGNTKFSGAVTIASTHGSLNRRNSVTFIMSTIGPLRPVMQSKDIPGAMRKLIGRPWPMAR